MSVIMEGVLRAVFAFIALLVLTRLLGKHSSAQLTFFDYVTGSTIGAMGALIAANLAVELWGAFAALLTFVVLLILNGYVSLESRPLRKLLQGEAVVVVHNGKILEGNLAMLRYSLDDLTAMLRNKGFFNISDVEFAIIETNGNLSVMPRSQSRPVTPKDIGMQTKYEGISSELVVDGRLIEQNLLQNNLSEEWLRDQLSKQGVFNYGEVAIASLGTDGKLYVDRKQDTLDNYTDISDKEI